MIADEEAEVQREGEQSQETHMCNSFICQEVSREESVPGREKKIFKRL